VKDREVLDSWKEIAAYLGRSEKTCRRLEKELGLPVHRLEDSPKARVFAYQVEIDQWREGILNGKLHNDDENSFSISRSAKNTQAISQEAITKEFRAYDIETSDLEALVSLIKKPKIVTPVLIIVIIVGLTAAYSLHRNAKIAWARNEALPQILRLVEKDDYAAAFRLARQADKYIRKDPILIEQLRKISTEVSITSNPLQAHVYIRDYMVTHGDWEYLGQTPIESVRIPKGYSKLKIAKDRYLPIERGVFDWMNPIHHQLDYEWSLPPGMIRVPGGNYEMILPVIGFSEAVQLGTFLIDKYEVTNRQYKEFVESGGYRDQSYWEHEFVKNGKTLSWKEAMAEFRDVTGRHGPATWELGTYPQGQDNYPVTGISWYEASAYAEFAGKSLPTVYHWTKAAGTKYCTAYIVPLSNFGGSGIAPVGKYQGMSPYGTYDMAGNAKEWCSNESGGLRFIMGGAWNSPSYQFNFANAYSAFDRSASNGFRCIKDLSLGETSEKVTQSINFSFPRDYSQEKLVSDEIFNIYKSIY
jgi:formylglycine-generating enzyme required for sulfatase activity